MIVQTHISILQTRLQNLRCRILLKFLELTMRWPEDGILKGNEQLFATKYKLYLPTEEQLRKEIERQKDLYNIQHSLSDSK